MMSADPKKLVDQLFRAEYGKVVAGLTQSFGIAHFEDIEDAVQDALVKAMQLWGYTAVPENPTAWIYKVSRNRLIDLLRKERKIQKEGLLQGQQAPENVNTGQLNLDNTIRDGQLKMIFACCHPSLSNQYQLILSLKLIGGFGNSELARALLKKEAAVAKAYTRAKKQMRASIKQLESPVEIGLRSRLMIVIRVLYLLFSEGYAANSGDHIIKREICYEAIRLALLLRENPYCRHQDLEALLALMCFHTARFDARQDKDGCLVDLEHQDRNLYNKTLIAIGENHLAIAKSMQRQASGYYLEAAVSHEHCIAPSFTGTRWKHILELYDRQLMIYDSPVVALNRIVALHKALGAEAALQALLKYKIRADYQDTVLYHAILAEVYREMGQNDRAVVAYRIAIDLNRNTIEKRHLQKKLLRMETEKA
jgi:RNA polymerase sigma-70 factor (ECF subfamily)